MSMPVLLRYLNARTLFLLLFYAAASAASFWLAYDLRFDFEIEAHPRHVLDRATTIWWVVGLQFLLLCAGGQANAIQSYFRLPDAIRLFAVLFANCLVLLLMFYVYGGHHVPPRSVALMHFLLSLMLIGGFRVFMRVKSGRHLKDCLAAYSTQNVIIVGAGELGASLCAELMSKARLGIRPVAFLDDDPRKIGRYVHCLPVAARVDELAKVARRYAAERVIIAFPTAPGRRVREVAELARAAELPIDTVPSLTDIMSGRAKVSHLRPIKMEDLLGRDPVDLNSDEIRAMLSGKRVLVTGAGGSIGSELVAQITTYDPASLLCIDQAEIAIFNLEQNLIASTKAPGSVKTAVADVLNTADMRAHFAAFHPEIVFHAAAHKHVSLMERQPDEALRNNFFATADLAQLAAEAQVERFILISTDKAINPTSVMGASKRLAEIAITAQQATPGHSTKFMALRFGNVLGSSGSVIPIFRRQIANGGPVTVTDPEVTRYFMMVEEAVGLVLQSATQGQGGEIFVLDMGKPVKIDDVARQMIALSGLRPGEDIEIDYIGLRSGEKRFEEVRHTSETLRPTMHERVLSFVSNGSTADIASIRSCLEEIMANGDATSIKAAIQKFVPEYTPA